MREGKKEEGKRQDGDSNPKTSRRETEGIDPSASRSEPSQKREEGGMEGWKVGGREGGGYLDDLCHGLL